MQTITDKREMQRKLLEDQGDALIEREQRLKHDSRIHKKLWEAFEQEFGDADEKYVDDGSFTEAGLKRLKMLFDDGKSNSEIARFFKVTPGAIYYHKEKWKLNKK